MSVKKTSAKRGGKTSKSRHRKPANEFDSTLKYPDGNSDFREYMQDILDGEDKQVLLLEPPCLDEAILGFDEISSRVIYDADDLVRVYTKLAVQDKEKSGAKYVLDEEINDAIDCVYNDTVPRCMRNDGRGAPIILQRFF